MKAISAQYSLQASVSKDTGSEVRTDTFLHPDSRHVSAVLYSAADPLNRPAQIGADFVLVHNPHAIAPLPRGFLRCGREYWKEGEQLHSHYH
jgi:hypothetical protein